MTINDMIAWFETRGFKVTVACTKTGHMFKISKYDYHAVSIYEDGFGGEVAQQQFLDRLLSTWNRGYRHKQETLGFGEALHAGYTMGINHTNERRVTDTWIGNMWPEMYLTMPPRNGKSLYKYVLNAVYGKSPDIYNLQSQIYAALMKGEQNMVSMFNDKTKDALIIMFRGYAQTHKLGISYNYDDSDILEMKFYMSRSYKPTKTVLIKLDELKNVFDTFTVVVKELDAWRNEIEPLYINWPDREAVAYVKADVENTARLYAAMREVQDRNNRRKLPAIKTTHFSGPVTAVIWNDGTKTIVRCGKNDTIDYEKGFAMAIAKKALGNTSKYYDIFKEHLPNPEVEEVESDG